MSKAGGGTQGCLGLAVASWAPWCVPMLSTDCCVPMLSTDWCVPKLSTDCVYLCYPQTGVYLCYPQTVCIGDQVREQRAGSTTAKSRLLLISNGTRLEGY